jgi:hypothetical protein
LQSIGFTHFFILRVGYWGSYNIINEIKAQEDFCAENDNCYIITRAPSLIPYPGATTSNWWKYEPSYEYNDCRDSYITNTTNNHFNEKAFKIFARKSADNIHRILHLGLEPLLEEENIKDMLPDDDNNEEPVEGEKLTPDESVLRHNIAYSICGTDGELLQTYSEYTFKIASDFIEIPEGYTISEFGAVADFTDSKVNGVNRKNCYCAFYDSNKKFISAYLPQDTDKKVVPSNTWRYTLIPPEVPSGAKYMRIAFNDLLGYSVDSFPLKERKTPILVLTKK